MNKTRRGFLAALALLPGLAFLGYKRQSVSCGADGDHGEPWVPGDSWSSCSQCGRGNRPDRDPNPFKFDLGQLVKWELNDQLYLVMAQHRTLIELPCQPDEMEREVLRSYRLIPHDCEASITYPWVSEHNLEAVFDLPILWNHDVNNQLT